MAENQPTNKHRMNKKLADFAARLRDRIFHHEAARNDAAFGALALELFSLQFENNAPYQQLCRARDRTPKTVEHWTTIPAVPTGGFKELEMTCLEPGERTAVFHSSGTTEQKPSRHFHCAESLALYEASLWRSFAPWFSAGNEFLALTPDAKEAPHSSLIHMFETAGRKLRSGVKFLGAPREDGTWTLRFDDVLERLLRANRTRHPVTLLGTAFSFVHLLDFLGEQNLQLALPEGSQVMETGGYKNRSRTLPKAELHGLITERLGVGRADIICEYGMSELSSQAYDAADCAETSTIQYSTFNVQGTGGTTHGENAGRFFRFPAWVRVQLISPETGREAAEGETGLARVVDLANVFSVAAIQTEDLAIRRGEGFELIGRAQLSEPRGCSLMSA